MSFYLLRNGIVGGKRVCNANNTVCEWLNGVAPSSDFLKLEREEEEEILVPISPSEVVRITNMRSPHLSKERVPTLARGEADFNSFATLSQFFEQAVRRSAAVCQLLKRCSDDDTNNFVEAFKDRLYSRDQLRRIFYDAKIEDDFWKSLPTTTDKIESSDIEKLRARITEAQKAKSKKGPDEDFEEGPEGFCIPAGTGFLVGPDYLLTNNHVLPDPESAKDFIARFRYDRNDNVDSTNLEFPPIDYKLDPSSFASSLPNQLDYTLVKLKPLSGTDPKRGLNFLDAGDNFGWLPLFEDDALVAPPLSKADAQLTDKLTQDLKAMADLFGLAGEPVNIIQHPRGRSKEIVFYSNRIQRISKKYIQYEADTDLGSSGSPVFNGQWQTVALHRAVLCEKNDNNVNLLGSSGIRTCAIAKHIKDEYAKALEKMPEIGKFIEEFVIPKDNYDKPRGTVFILAQVSKKDLNIDISKETVSQMSNSIASIAKGIEEANVSSDFEHKKVLSDFGYEVKLIKPLPTDGLQSDGEIIGDWLKSQPKFKVGDIAIYITMDAYTIEEPNSDGSGTIKKVVENDSLRGVGVFYAGNRAERQAQAQLFLQNLLNQELKQLPSSEQPESVYKKTISLALPNRGVKTDLTFIREPEDDPTDEQLRQLPFTRSLGIPSLILRLGFITNPKDREVIMEDEEEITQGIARSLLVWGNSINPVPMEAYLPKEADSSMPDQSVEKAAGYSLTTNLLPSANILSRFSL